MSAREIIHRELVPLISKDKAKQPWPDAILAALTASGYRILGPDDIARLTTQIAQLRHAYTHLNAERVTHQREFANGLVHPAIAALEEALCATHQGDK